MTIWRMMRGEIPTVIAHRDDGPVIGLTSVVIGELHDHHAETLLDYRIYAQTIQGGYGDAEKDAQEIISKEPTISLGYLRLGSLYQMQGKQQSAINVYKAGLEKVPVDDRGYVLMLEYKGAATKQSEKRVDFIAKLPIEVVDETIALLPLATILNCLRTSTAWKAKVLACENTWRYLEVTDQAVHGVPAAVIDSVAAHVESLKIKTRHGQLFEVFISRMHAGCFSKVKSLYLSSAIIRHISASTMQLMASAFHNISATLTSLVLYCSKDQISMTLADLLGSLTNLRSLVYSSPGAPFTSIVGTLPLPKPHCALIDLDVNATSITGDDLIPLLQDCPNIEQMALNRCNNSVLDIVDAKCPNLKKLVYNVGGDTRFPPRNQSALQCPSGLQEFSVWQHQSLDSVIDLLRRNTETLKVLDLSITKLSCEYLSVTPYLNMEFKRLKKITFEGHANDVIPQLILQWISNCTTLTDIDASSLYDATNLAQVLINRPRLVSLSLKRLTAATVPMNLTDLFSSYAAKFRENEPEFQNIALHFCKVTGDVLRALSSIKTLASITLSNISVSPFDLDSLFNFLGESTTDIHLDHMQSVTDQHLAVLGNLKGLRSVHLEFLRSLTDSGVIEMTNNAPVLCSLTIKYCGRGVTSRSIAHAKKRIKNVIYKSLYS